MCREYDKVTLAIKSMWRDPHFGEVDLWFAMCVARLLNLPESLQELGYPVPWNATRFMVVLSERKQRGLNNFNAAYIVSTNGVKMDKLDYLEARVLTPLWNNRERVRPRPGEELATFHNRLMGNDGFGTFLAAQVVADIKYTPPLNTAHDWWTFAASGPGSRRGLNRALGKPVESPWGEYRWKEAIVDLYSSIRRMYGGNMPWPPLHMQDFQSCLCEFDKYERILHDQGRPKQKYDGER